MTSTVREVEMAPPTRTTRNNSTAEMTVDQKLDLLLSELADIKSDNREFRNDMAEIKQEIKEFKCDVNKALEFCNEQITSCVSELKECKDKLQRCESTIEELQSANTSLQKQLLSTKQAQFASDQYSRSNCLEIRGVPHTKQENVIDVVKNVAKAINFKLEEGMIDAVHRLSQNPKDPGSPRGIILKFCRRLDMEAMRARTRVKNGFSAAELGYTSENKVFVNLSLTRETRVLWMDTRAAKQRKGYKYAWMTSAGKIFVRREEGTRAIHIASKADLELLK